MGKVVQTRYKLPKSERYNIYFYFDVKLFAKAGVIEVELDVKSWLDNH